MTQTEKPSLSIVELQEQLAFFQNRCLVLRAEVERRDVTILTQKAQLEVFEKNRAGD